MAKTSRPTANKRMREKARIDRQKEKEQRRLEAKERKANNPQPAGDEDPDLAGMRLGPQPQPEWMVEEAEEEAEEEEESAG